MNSSEAEAVFSDQFQESLAALKPSGRSCVGTVPSVGNKGTQDGVQNFLNAGGKGCGGSGQLQIAAHACWEGRRKREGGNSASG